jgi:hypothetical protein
MTETYGDYAGGVDTSASEVFFGDGPAETLDDSEYYDDVDEALDDADYDLDGVDPDYNPSIEELVGQGLAAGMHPYLAGLQARQQADAVWADMQARNEYGAHVRTVAAFEEADEIAGDLIEDAGRRYGVPESAGNGTVRWAANELLSQAYQDAYDSGDVARCEWLKSRDGGEAAIEAAAELTQVARFGELAHRDSRLGSNPQYEARQRAAFDAYARDKGIYSIREDR